MGVQGLKSRVKQFSQDIEWLKPQHDGNTSVEQSSERSTAFIIDGPSFAYHIFHLCITKPSDSRKQPYQEPSYKELGEAAVCWLETVEQFNINVTNIFFDGYLPTTKTNTRFQRLQAHMNQLRWLRGVQTPSSATGSSSSAVQHTNIPSNGESTRRQRRVTPPAPPFLVPLVIQALRMSQFRDRIHIVPGEADAFCAGYAKEPGDAIISNDSDLVLYETAAKIVPLEELRYVSKINMFDKLQGSYYTRAHVARCLKTQNLLKVAFYLNLDCHRSLKACVELAAKPFTSSELLDDFETFQKGYVSQRFSRCALRGQLCCSQERLLDVMQRLDPRASELMVSWAREARSFQDDLPNNENRISTLTSPKEISMYLYPLLDDPTRSSAWQTSYKIRRLAYSFLATSLEDIGIVEVDRRGQRICQCFTSPLKSDELTASCNELLEQLRMFPGNGNLDQAVDSWRTCASVLVIEQLRINGQLPRHHVLVAALQGVSHSSSTWEGVHFVAQIEGMIYSLHLLKHVLETLWFETYKAPSQEIVLNEIYDLSQQLSGLPNLIHLIHASGTDSFALSALALEKLQASLPTLSKPLPSVIIGPQKRRKKRQEEESAVDKKCTTELESLRNMYTVLTPSGH